MTVTGYPDTAKRVDSPPAPRVPGALELVDDGLNTLSAELERLEHRLAPVLTEHRPSDTLGPDQAHPTSLHAQARRVHGLVSALSDITDRIAL
jgi:hypothetical protein